MKNIRNLGYIGFITFIPTQLKSALNAQMKIEETFIRLCAVAGKEKASIIMEEIKQKCKEQIFPADIYIVNELNKSIQSNIQGVVAK